MDIGKKIEEVFGQMKQRPMLMDKFYELESMEQVYEFFHSIRGGYTKQEFYDYISNFLDELDELDEDNSDDEINIDDLDNVAGGVGMQKKALAGVLAAMSLFPAAPTGLHAMENAQNSTKIEAKADKDDKASDENAKAAEETKAPEENNGKQEVKKKSGYFSKIKKFLFRNKGKIALTFAVVALSAITFYNRDKIGDGANKIIEFLKETFASKTKIKLDGLKDPIDMNLDAKTLDEEINKKIGDNLKENSDFKNKLIEEYYSKSKNMSWYNKIPVIRGIVSMLSLGAGAAMNVSDLLGYISKLQNLILDIVNPYGLIGRVFDFNKVICDPVTPVESNENINKAFSEIKGQEKAKKQLRRAISSMVVDKYSDFLKGDSPKTGDVFYFIGPSGVGKTYMALKLCEHKAFTNDDQPYLFSAGDIDSKSEESIVEQIFGPKSSDYYGHDGNRKTKSSLYSYIKNHPSGVVIFDEYDKLPDNSLDEVFRSVMDKGKVTVAGQELDCSGVTFILTSNESKESLNLKGGNKAREDDDSITYHTHDVSFTNRIRIVEFEKLFEDNFVEIAKTSLYGKLRERYSQKEMGGINLTMSDDTLQKIADKAVKYGKGARYITIDLVQEAAQALTELLFNNYDGNIKKFKGKTVELVYKLVDVSEEEAKYDAPMDEEGKYYVKVGDTYKRWEFEAILKD